MLGRLAHAALTVALAPTHAAVHVAVALFLPSQAELDAELARVFGTDTDTPDAALAA